MYAWAIRQGVSHVLNGAVLWADEPSVIAYTHDLAKEEISRDHELADWPEFREEQYPIVRVPVSGMDRPARPGDRVWAVYDGMGGLLALHATPEAARTEQGDRVREMVLQHRPALPDEERYSASLNAHTAMPEPLVVSVHRERVGGWAYSDDGVQIAQWEGFGAPLLQETTGVLRPDDGGSLDDAEAQAGRLLAEAGWQITGAWKRADSQGNGGGVECFAEVPVARTAEPTLPQRFTAWVVNDSSCLDGDVCDVTVLEDELIGADPDDEDAWTSTATRHFHALTTVDAKDGDAQDAIDEAKSLLAEAGWQITGKWNATPSAYVATVERA